MVECENCENGLVYKWKMTRHGYDTKAERCQECDGKGHIEDEESEGSQPHRDSGLPTFEQIEEWKRLK